MSALYASSMLRTPSEADLPWIGICLALIGYVLLFYGLWKVRPPWIWALASIVGFSAVVFLAIVGSG